MNSKCVGKLYAQNSEFKWVIKTDYFISKKEDEYLSSPIFYTTEGSSNVLKWQADFYPKGAEESSEDYMSIYLINLNDFEVELYYDASLLNKFNKKVQECQGSNKITMQPGDCYGYANFVKESFVWTRKKTIIQDDQLTILFKLIFDKKIDSKIEKVASNPTNTFEKLLMDEKYSDIAVIAQGKYFHLHKCILAAHSVVFDKMFEKDKNEKNKNILEINDIESKTLDFFFQFLYTGKVDGIDKVVCELLYAAEKYDVAELSEICHNIMINNLNAENAIKYLQIAETNNSKKLKKKVIKFIAEHLGSFTSDPNFKSFGESCPKLLFEIMEVIGHEKKI